MKAVVYCCLCMLAAEAGMIAAFLSGVSQEEILVGMLALFAVCLLYIYIRITGGRGTGT